ncbi:hypothetical protein DPMN_047403 [Dreissena polymorpha]|uniref:Uncharacterized protein n=1 Tax=Dreissena polymorpha TaxID=45954 RepID=A0A9D4I1G1_DREPO|nr:hypothetical protein DPMN_047403 [Dreissena polymorpha]
MSRTECVSSKNNTSVNDVMDAGCAGFLCTNGTCLPMMKRCDVTIQCRDGEDEIDCPTVDRESNPIHYILCVHGARRGDGTRDCMDDTDEWFVCNKTTIPRRVLGMYITH